jgi:uncharacterized membrane protein YoaK (UPF0700 family)
VSDPDRGDRTRRSPYAIHLARVLGTTGGFVDAVGYVALFHLFTAHQSGNSAGLGVAIGHGEWGMAWRRVSAIGAFFVGVALGTLIVEQFRRRRPRWAGTAVATAELLALAAALGVGTSAAPHGTLSPADTASYAAAATSLAAGMGMQNVLLRRIGSDATPSTYVTGILTATAELFVVALHLKAGEGRGPTLRRAGFLGSIWFLYLVGAIAGGAAETAWGFAALSVPLAVVAAVAVWQARAGVVPSLPPTSVPVQRSTAGRAGDVAIGETGEA